MYRILIDDEPAPPNTPQGPGDPVVFFSSGRGGTWKQWDNVLFSWTGPQYMLIFMFVAAVVGLVWWRGLRARVARRRRHNMYDTFMTKR